MTVPIQLHDLEYFVCSQACMRGTLCDNPGAVALDPLDDPPTYTALWCEYCGAPINFEAEYIESEPQPMTYLWPTRHDDPVWGATIWQHRIAREWHSGQASMLYAISSSDGWLRFGSVIPYGCESYKDWARVLLQTLRAELAEINKAQSVQDNPNDQIPIGLWIADLDKILDADDEDQDL